MSTLQHRRRLRQRRQAKRGGAGLKIALFLVLGLGALGALSAVAAVGTVFAVYQNYADEYVPIEDKLRQTQIGLTEIYDRNGERLGALPNPDAQLLDPVTLDRISKWVIEATISTEDNTFWDNPGINFAGLMRAAWENYVGGGIGSGTGGSSITQQLIKNVYICPNIATETSAACLGAAREGKAGVDRKLREITYALELEKDYPKEKILQWYLNQISYADRYIGIQAAAQGYFHKDAADLSLAESALLAGVPQYPTLYHPRLNCAKVNGDPEGECAVDGEGRTTVVGAAKQRQEEVLDLMLVHRRATAEEVAAAKTEPLLVYAATNPIKAAAFIDNQVQPRLQRMCEAGILPKLEAAKDCAASVASAGYKVTTTLDAKETEVALGMLRDFVAEGLKNGCECYNAAVVTIEPSTGQVIVYAPNRDPSYRSDRRVAGEIDQLNEINQPGSSFKPAVYLTWFDKLNKAPMSILWDTSPLPVEGTEIVNPRQGDPKSEGLITARGALGGSQNVGAFRAAQEAGVDNVIEMAKRLGITTLHQRFDPTFRSHPDVTYGASIATGGANIRAIDMAYMDATISNMGVMVGTPNLVPKDKYIDPKNLKSTALDKGADYELALQQALDFAHGHIRLPGTRELDPVVVLQVTDHDGYVVYTEPEPQRREMVNPGSVWLLHSIMSDCTARFIIWNCGGSNNDLQLDFFLEGTKIPGGVKTGTQQGPKSAADTLETWMTGYSRYAATALWVGNATNELVRDGPQYNYAAANTTVKLFKNWMGEYHRYLRDKGTFSTPAGFDPVRPRNVAQLSFTSPHTERKGPGGCDQTVTGWRRTDVSYADECEEREIDSRNGQLASDATPSQYRVKQKFPKLPSFKTDAAIELAKQLKIPIAPTEKSSGTAAVVLTSLSPGKTVNTVTNVVGSVANTGNLKGWKLEIGTGAAPTEWKALGQGTNPVTDAVMGTINPAEYPAGVYTVRLTADDPLLRGLSTSVTINIQTGGTPTSGTPTVPFGSTPRPQITPQLPVPNTPVLNRTPTPPP